MTDDDKSTETITKTMEYSTTTTPLTETTTITTSETIIDPETSSSPLDQSTSEAVEYSTGSTKTSETTESDSTVSKDTSTTTKESGPASEIKVLGCSFDDTNPSCAMKFKTNITVPTYSIVLFSFQTVGTYRITDVTSISKFILIVVLTLNSFDKLTNIYI